jgi:hypothetical protein
MKRSGKAILLMAAVTGLSACGSATGSDRTAAAPGQGAVADRSATAERNAVADWAAIVAPAVHSAAEPRPPGSAEVLHTVAHLAVYDAVMAIKGGHKPYAKAVEAPAGADLDAAVATAAYRAARGRVAPSQFAYLDGKYHDYLAPIADGEAKTAGIGVGEKAADAVLAKRAGDGFATAVGYQCSADPLPLGEFEPNDGCGTEPVDAKLAKVVPFTSTARFGTDGPDKFTSGRWVADFNEVKAYGRKDSSVRTAEQTDVAYFWSEHAYIHWNRNLIELATAKHLNTPDTARLFAMVHTSASDAAIAGFQAKYQHRTWRPRTAIPRAAEDGNDKTAPDATWTPLLSVNHPEYPSGHGFYTYAVAEAVAAFFGTHRLTWTVGTSTDAVPQIIRTTRTYQSLHALMDDVDDARVWSGLHYRNSMREGGVLGRQIAKHVTNDYFRPVS